MFNGSSRVRIGGLNLDFCFFWRSTCLVRLTLSGSCVGKTEVHMRYEGSAWASFKAYYQSHRVQNVSESWHKFYPESYKRSLFIVLRVVRLKHWRPKRLNNDWTVRVPSLSSIMGMFSTLQGLRMMVSQLELHNSKFKS